MNILTLHSQNRPTTPEIFGVRRNEEQEFLNAVTAARDKVYHGTNAVVFALNAVANAQPMQAAPAPVQANYHPEATVYNQSQSADYAAQPTASPAPDAEVQYTYSPQTLAAELAAAQPEVLSANDVYIDALAADVAPVEVSAAPAADDDTEAGRQARQQNAYTLIANAFEDAA